MDYIEIFKNAFHYTIDDSNKFFKISAPNILVGLIFGIATLLVLMGVIGSIGYSSVYVGSPMVVIGGLLYFVGGILGIFAAIFDSGAFMTAMRNSIGGSSELPEVAIGEFFVNGLKMIIVTFIYQLIPLIVFALLLVAALAISSTVFIFLAILILVVLSFIISLLLPVAFGKLAETDSIGEALSIGNVWEITGKIGFINIFIMVLLLAIIGGVASSVAYLIALIPLIGPIGAAMLATFIMLFYARVYALIYMEQFAPKTYGTNNNQQQSNPNQLPNQSQNQIPNQQNNQLPNQQDNQLPEQSQKQLDYQPPQENKNTTPSDNTIYCPECGKENPDTFKHCTNCGKDLK